MPIGLHETTTGWEVRHVAIGGPCDKQGRPFLFDNLNQDSINYPADLGEYLEVLWDAAERNDLPEADIQACLDQLGVWIQEVEKATPSGLWSNFK